MTSKRVEPAGAPFHLNHSFSTTIKWILDIIVGDSGQEEDEEVSDQETRGHWVAKLWQHRRNLCQRTTLRDLRFTEPHYTAIFPWNVLAKLVLLLNDKALSQHSFNNWTEEKKPTVTIFRVFPIYQVHQHSSRSVCMCVLCAISVSPVLLSAPWRHKGDTKHTQVNSPWSTWDSSRVTCRFKPLCSQLILDFAPTATRVVSPASLSLLIREAQWYARARWNLSPTPLTCSSSGFHGGPESWNGARAGLQRTGALPSWVPTGGCGPGAPDCRGPKPSYNPEPTCQHVAICIFWSFASRNDLRKKHSGVTFSSNLLIWDPKRDPKWSWHVIYVTYTMQAMWVIGN